MLSIFDVTTVGDGGVYRSSLTGLGWAGLSVSVSVGCRERLTGSACCQDGGLSQVPNQTNKGMRIWDSSV